jgi:hypothetical protein
MSHICINSVITALDHHVKTVPTLSPSKACQRFCQALQYLQALVGQHKLEGHDLLSTGNPSDCFISIAQLPCAVVLIRVALLSSAVAVIGRVVLPCVVVIISNSNNSIKIP